MYTDRALFPQALGGRRTQRPAPARSADGGSDRSGGSGGGCSSAGTGGRPSGERYGDSAHSSDAGRDCGSSGRSGSAPGGGAESCTARYGAQGEHAAAAAQQGAGERPTQPPLPCLGAGADVSSGLHARVLFGSHESIVLSDGRSSIMHACRRARMQLLCCTPDPAWQIVGCTTISCLLMS